MHPQPATRPTPGDLAPPAPAEGAQARVAAALAEFERAEGADLHELPGLLDGVYQQLRAALDVAQRA